MEISPTHDLHASPQKCKSKLWDTCWYLLTWSSPETNENAAQGTRQQGPHSSSGSCKLAQPFWENTRLWQKLMSYRLILWSRIKLVALYPDELQVRDPTKACAWVFRAALCIKGHKLEAAKTPPSSVWIHNPVQIRVLPSSGIISSIGCKWSNHTKIWRNSTIIFLSDNILYDNKSYF